jgi:hypothetical protein
MEKKVWVRYEKRVHGHPSVTYFLFDKDKYDDEDTLEYYFENHWPSKLPGGENAGYEHECEMVDHPPIDWLERDKKYADRKAEEARVYAEFIEKELIRVKIENSVKIKSKCGNFEIIIDHEDIDKVNDFSPNGWEAKITTGSHLPYAITRKTTDGVRKQYYLHRLIMDVLETSNIHIDHKNGNKLDNRKENLRIATRVQNMKNRTSAKNSTSKFLGTYYCKNKRGIKKWRSVITPYNHPNIHLGYHETEEQGAYAYNLAAKIIHKEFANFNELDSSLVDNKEEIEFKVSEYLKLKSFI